MVGMSRGSEKGDYIKTVAPLLTPTRNSDDLNEGYTCLVTSYDSRMFYSVFPVLHSLIAAVPFFLFVNHLSLLFILEKREGDV